MQHAIEASAARHVVSDAPNKLGGSVDDALKNVSLLMPPKTEPNVRRWGMEKQKYKIK